MTPVIDVKSSKPKRTLLRKTPPSSEALPNGEPKNPSVVVAKAGCNKVNGLKNVFDDGANHDPPSISNLAISSLSPVVYEFPFPCGT